MSHYKRYYHTTAPVALALDGINRMRDCCGDDFDHQFVSALTARLPFIAEQGRARHPRQRGNAIYKGAFERIPVVERALGTVLTEVRPPSDRLPRLPIFGVNAGA